MGILGQVLCMNKFWNWSIGLFVDLFKNYGWAIIVFTIALKLILSPLDFLQRRATIQNSRMQAIVQPEIEQINKKYSGQRDVINQKTMEVYKKHNYNVTGTCFTMLINIVITFVVFLTLFSSLNSLADRQLVSQYTQLKSAYEVAVTEGTDIDTAVLDTWDEYKDENSWLWIKNVWIGDSSKSQFVSYSEWYKKYKKTDEYKSLIAGKSDEEIEAFGTGLKSEYDTIKTIVMSQKSNQGWNGYYILVVLAGGVTFLSQWITSRASRVQTKSKNGEVKTQQSTNFLMMFLLPAVMVIFALTSNSAFSLYLIVNSAMTSLIGLIAGKVVNKSDDADQGGRSITITNTKSSNVVNYSRNYVQPSQTKAERKRKKAEDKANKYFGQGDKK